MYGTLIVFLHKFSVPASKANLAILDNLGEKSWL